MKLWRTWKRLVFLVSCHLHAADTSVIQAAKYEQMMTHRVTGISQNLHRALQTHSRLAHDDIQAALIEHARSALVYERQFLRELEALRPDVRNAASKAPEPVKPIVPPAPPLEDLQPFRPTHFSPAPVPRAPPAPIVGGPLAPGPVPPTRGGFAPLPATPVSPAPRSPMPQSPAAPFVPVSAAPGPRGPPLITSDPPLMGAGVQYSARSPRDPLAPVSPGAGSSSAGPGPSSQPGTPAIGHPGNGFANGNGYTDPLRGTQSMIVTPNSAGGRPGFYEQRSPLTPNGYPQPSSPQTMNHLPPGVRVDGLPGNGSNFVHPLARSMAPTPTRSRLDAREAAAKLANFL